MSSSNSASLRPAWYKGGGAGGGRGFQPPPTVTSERGEKGRSASWESQERRDSNKFSALDDDDEDGPAPGGNGNSDDKPTGNARSEAFRTSFSRASSAGTKTGRSLADLAARVPEGAAPTGRRIASGYDSARPAGTGRFPVLPGRDASGPSAAGGSTDSYKSDPKVIRFTREKLLSMRPRSTGDEEIPDELKLLEGAVIISTTPQDPVCWDTFDGEEIWEVSRERRLSGGTPKAPEAPPGGLRPSLAEPTTGDPRRRNAPSSGRWQRGVALPPPEEGGRRKERDAENPNELWDDPVGGATGAASDFSAFGAMPLDEGEVVHLNKMAEASKKLEEELQEAALSDTDIPEGDDQHMIKIDKSRPLASAGMTIASGSGDGVNVFEDFDSPAEPQATAVRGGGEDPTASSRLMKMIGVEPPKNDGEAKDASSNPWATSADNASADPVIGSIGGLSLNPWGSTVGQAPGSQPPDRGMDLSSVFAAEQKAQAAEMEKRAQQEAEMRRRQEEEVQRRSLAQRQAEDQARQQQAQAAVMQQQQPSPQSQVELVLMERICSILENSWGRSDLVSVLTTLHSEDSRVIPLLGNVDALRALIARSPQRIALRRDPNFAGDMAVLLMTNAQWQQQQQVQARLQQEDLQRRRLEEEERARVQALNRATAQINPDAPWFYSDPQANIQGPFRGEEMRQWLEAGYFKGDLPISQQPSGPFHPLSALFPDLSRAFKAPVNNSGQEEAERKAAEDEHRRKEAEQEERRAAAEAAAQAEERQRVEMERQMAEVEAAAAEKAQSSNGGNESSTHLKMMLGLSSTAQPGEDSAPKDAPETTSKKLNAEKRSSKGNKMPQQKPVEETPTPAPVVKASQSAKPTSTAWGGAASAKPKKSMSEIQQEEARAAALMASQQDGLPRQSSSGWANVAAGTSGWGSGALKPTAAAAPGNPGAVAGARAAQPRATAQTGAPVATTTANKATPTTQQQRSTSTVSSSTPAEEFGATMSPALEKWCKEQMHKINGSDDLTLVAFCMTLNDANEIRQYLTTYLGGTPQVNNFATEFINMRGLGNRQEEWETPGSAKKGRKKKAGGR